MQEANFFNLSALASGSRHGYGIISVVDRISEGRVRLRAGTLYAALDRLQGGLDLGRSGGDRRESPAALLSAHTRGAGQLATEATRLKVNTATAFKRPGEARSTPR
jgi:hypothetical protein